MKSPSIRRTLLDELFRRPRPLAFRQFQRARSYLFPGESEFRQFLSSDDPQELNSRARSILLRLSYQHYASPPSRLLLNLADFEDGVRDVVKAGDYVPRDHFVHLVNLYLLGIYLFAYHGSFHAGCVTELNRRKREFLSAGHQITGRLTGRATSYHLFASTWSQFVLSHDLAYPLEKVHPSNREASIRWLKPYSRIRKSILKDLGLEALSRLLVLTSIVDDASLGLDGVYLNHETDFCVARTLTGHRRRYIAVHRDGDVLTSEVQGAEGEWAVAQVSELFGRWGKALLLSKARTLGALNLVGALLPDRNLAAVLEAGTGAPLVVVFKETTQGPIWCQRTDEFPAWMPRDPKALWSLAFSQAISPSQESRWQYFGVDLQAHLNAVVAGIPGLSAALFRDLLASLANDEDFRGATGVDNDPVAAEAFIAYDRLSRMLGYLEDEESSDRSSRIFSRYSAGFDSVGKALPALASDVIAETLKELLPAEKTFRPGEVLRTNDRETAVKNIASAVWKVIEQQGRKAFERRLAASITPVLTARIKLEESLRAAHLAVRASLEKLLPSEDEDGNGFASARFDAKFALSAIEEGSAQLSSISRELAKRGLGSLKDLTAKYRPGWVKDDPVMRASFVDHGLAGAYVAASVAGVYQEVIEALKMAEGAPVPAAVGLLRLAAGTTSKADERWLAFEVDALTSVVGFSVAIHNLYPGDLKGGAGKYRTRLGQDPFAFLALLADGFQKWDRRSLVNSALSDAKLSPAGSRFDLQVSGNLLVVSLSAARMSMERQEESLRGVLSTYLDDAASLVRLQLREELHS